MVELQECERGEKMVLILLLFSKLMLKNLQLNVSENYSLSLASFSFRLMNFYLLVEIIQNLPGSKIFHVHSNRFFISLILSPRSS